MAVKSFTEPIKVYSQMREDGKEDFLNSSGRLLFNYDLQRTGSPRNKTRRYHNELTLVTDGSWISGPSYQVAQYLREVADAIEADFFKDRPPVTQTTEEVPTGAPVIL